MMSVQTTLFGYKNVLHAYLPLSSMSRYDYQLYTFAMTLRGGGGGGGGVHNLMSNDANFLKIVWKCPLTISISGGSRTLLMGGSR